jgi:hypothetical protein
MAFVPSKLLVVDALILPLLIWLIVYLAGQWWAVNSRPILPWLKTLRWIGWGSGVILFALSFALSHISPLYGLAMTTFSAGLSIPEAWIKRRFSSSTH